MNSALRRGGVRHALLLALLSSSTLHAKVWVVDQFMGGLAKGSEATSSEAVSAILSQLRAGDALVLSEKVPLGKVTIGEVASDIEVTGGFGGELRVKGRLSRWKFHLCGFRTDFVADEGSSLDGCYFSCSFSGGRFIDHASGTFTAEGLGLTPRMAGEPALSRIEASPTSGDPGAPHGLLIINESSWGSKSFWMPVYYANKAGVPQETDKPQAFLANGSGGKFLFAIEAGQGALATCVRINSSQRCELYSGSTEGNNPPTRGVYEMNDCNQVVLGMRRFFSNHNLKSTWFGNPAFGLVMKGGSGNILHNLIEFSNPKSQSVVSNDAKLQIWNSALEDRSSLAASTFQCAVTHSASIVDNGKVTEPVLVDDEVILRDGATDLLGKAASSLPVPPAFGNQPWSSTAKAAQHDDVGALERRYTSAEGFGSEFIAAGADPTGRRLSDAAFETIMNNDGIVRLPAGVFRVSKPVLVRGAAKMGTASPAAIVGAGRGKTRIVADRSVAAVIDLRGFYPLGKRQVPMAREVIAIEGITIEGGQNGVWVADDGVSTIMNDFAIRGFSKAGIMLGTLITVPGEGQSCGSDANCADCHYYKNGDISGGDYGICYTAFADKQGIMSVNFSGHRIAGISARNTNLFHGWIGKCNFTNITGPGVDISGGYVLPASYSEKYYTQWVTMIEGCKFTECGSATRAAVDFGLTDINMLCNSSITTTGKQIRYGFLGSLAQMSHVTINVNATRAAMALRSPRTTEASRTPGTIIHTVTCNGKMLFVNGLPAGSGASHESPLNDMVYSTKLVRDPAFGATGQNHAGKKWWQKGVYDWAFIRLFYNSTINGAKYNYVLTNGAGFAKELETNTDITLTGVEQVGELIPPSSHAAVQVGARSPGNARPPAVYGLDGRRVGARLRGRQVATRLPPGVHVLDDGHGARLEMK